MTDSRQPGIREYTGMCDASASVLIGTDHFIAASDEDNVLRVYRLDMPGDPIASFDWSEHLGIAPDDEHPETDLEAAAGIGSRIFWITSHGTNKNGKPRPNRRRFFATDVTVADGRVQLTPFGTPFRLLVEALGPDPRLAKFNLAERATNPPESAEGLNIEGLAATQDGRLLIGFRNPVPDDLALIVPLENPTEVLANASPVRLGDPIRLKLGNLGIRSIDFAPAHEAYFIVAGPVGDVGQSALYRWSGDPGDDPVHLEHVDFAGLNPEAVLALPPPDADLILLSDDGGRVVNGVECKKAAPEQRKFRSLRITP